eukprot:2263482-Pleurochrysis_carterae.AAC.4
MVDANSHESDAGDLLDIEEAVGHLVARADEVLLNRAFELALADVILPGSYCLVFVEAPAWSAYSTAAELSMSNKVAPPLTLVPVVSS